jgi:2-phosphosulfolactate phosphatase
LSQEGYHIRCEWGEFGVDALASCRTFIVVDVLSFSTCVVTAAERGASIIPLPADGDAAEFAEKHNALLAGPRGDRYSLSPLSLLTLPSGSRLVLRSPNGARVTGLASDRGRVVAGCLRNARGVGAIASALDGPFAVIPAGERWRDGSLRPALEDLLGAGAIAAALPGDRSPEAASAVAAFESARPNLRDVLRACTSGLELAQRGYQGDVDHAAELDACPLAPELVRGAFVPIPVGGRAG